MSWWPLLSRKLLTERNDHRENNWAFRKAADRIQSTWYASEVVHLHRYAENALTMQMSYRMQINNRITRTELQTNTTNRIQIMYTLSVYWLITRTVTHLESNWKLSVVGMLNGGLVTRSKAAIRTKSVQKYWECYIRNVIFGIYHYLPYGKRWHDFSVRL